MMKRWLIPFVLLLLPAAGHTTTFNEQPFEKTIQEAPVIVRGRTGMKYTNWATGGDGNRRIYTFFELSIDEVFKGISNPPRSIIMREVGGEKDGVGLKVAGTADFKPGEDVVVTLNAQNSDGTYDIRGMMQAKYEVVRGDDGQEYLQGAGTDCTVHPGLRGKEALLHRHDNEKDGEHNGAKWTIERLRQETRPAAPSAPESKKAPVPKEIKTPAPSATPAVAPSNEPAPGLHSQSEGGIPLWFSVALAVTLLGAGAWLWLRRR